MTGSVARPRSGATRGREMPTIGWLLVGVGVWLAGVGATCALLTATKRADAGAAAGRHARELRGPRLPSNDAPGRAEPRLGALAVGVRAPALAAAMRAIAPRGPGARRLRSPPGRVDGAQPTCAHSYALHVRGAMVGRLRWRIGPGGAAGWYMSPRRGSWRRLAVDPDLDATVGFAARRPGGEQAADLAASLSTALALDAAADLLRGPPASPPRPLPRGGYEVHATGLAFDVVPIAFPEAITARAGDTSVLTGHFDDRGLSVLTRRIAILGGHVLAISQAEEPHAPHPSS